MSRAHRPPALLAAAAAALAAFPLGYFTGTTAETLPMRLPEPMTGPSGGADEEIQQLRNENQRLRASLADGTAEPSRVVTDAAVSVVDSSAPIPAAGSVRADEAIDFLMQQLGVQHRSGALRAFLASQGGMLSSIVLQTWLHVDQAAQALADLRQLAPGTVSGGLIMQIVERLREGRDLQGAREALLIGLRNEPSSNTFIEGIADLDPAAGLALLQELVGADPLADGNFDLHRFHLLLAGRRHDEAMAMVASLRGAEPDEQDPAWLRLLTRYSPKRALELLAAENANGGASAARQMAIARAQQGAGDAAGAKSSLQALLRENPQMHEAWSALIALDPQQALAQHDQLVGAEPDDRALIRRADILTKLGRTEDAIAAYEGLTERDWGAAAQGLLRLAPERALALSRARRDDEMIGDIADIALGEGRRAEAEALYREAHDIDPTDSEWRGKLRSLRENR